MSPEHIWEHIGCEVMPRTVVHFSPKPQMRERRSSTIRVVSEWLDCHCGDGLVFLLFAVGLSTNVGC